MAPKPAERFIFLTVFITVFFFLLFHSPATTHAVSSDTCRPVTKIIYIKTQKTGSGTTTSIWTVTVSLTISHLPVPSHGPIISRIDNIYKYKPIISKSGFDILDNHAAFYDRQKLDKVVPKAKYITTIRDPVTHFESAFVKFRVAKHASIKNSTHPMTAFFKQNHFESTLVTLMITINSVI